MAIEYVNRRRPYRVVVRVKQKKRSKSFFRKADAQAWERKILLLGEGLWKEEALTPPTVIPVTSLNALKARFTRDYAESRQAPSTRIMEKGLFDNYIKSQLGDRDIRLLKRKDFQELFLWLSQEHRLSNERINRIRSLLNCLFNQAVLWELVAINPVSATQPLPQKNYTKEEVINYLSQEEAVRLLDWLVVYDPWLYAKVRVLLNTGIRYGEMVALRVGDLQMTPNGGRLSISRSYCRHSQQIRNRTKGRKSRSIPLRESMARFLYLEVATDRHAGSLLFWQEGEEHKHPTKFYNHFKIALKSAGVRPIRVHDLRHTFAVHFLERGGQLYDLQKLLGHHSVRLTERYSHFSVVMSERARGLVDHHGDSSSPPFTVIDGGVRGQLSHTCPTELESA